MSRWNGASPPSRPILRYPPEPVELAVLPCRLVPTRTPPRISTSPLARSIISSAFGAKILPSRILPRITKLSGSLSSESVLARALKLIAGMCPSRTF